MLDQDFGKNSHPIRQDVNSCTEGNAPLVIFVAKLAFFVFPSAVPTGRTLGVAAYLGISTCLTGACSVFPLATMIVIVVCRHLIDSRI